MSTAPKLTHNLDPEPEDRPRQSGPGPIPLVAIVGPTASGKSSLGVWLARKFGGEVLACDSTQVYRGFDIGTSKPSAEERDGVPHHLLDLVDPTFPFTAGEYRLRAVAVLEDLRQRSRLPILPSGRGFICARCWRGWPTPRPARKNCARASKRVPMRTACNICIACCGAWTRKPRLGSGRATAPR